MFVFHAARDRGSLIPAEPFPAPEINMKRSTVKSFLAGIVIGLVVFGLLLAALAYCACRAAGMTDSKEGGE